MATSIRSLLMGCRNRASAKIFRVLPEINLFDLNSDFPEITIKRKFSFFKANFDISKRDGVLYHFITKSFWKGHFQCTVGSDVYDIYSHRSRKHSIYKNDRQVGWWDQKAVSWFNGDNYTVTIDKDCDKALIIAFCLAVDNYANNDKKKGALNINPGRLLAPQARKFDPLWMPK